MPLGSPGVAARRISLFALLVPVLALLSASTLSASAAVLRGTVSDPDGRAVAGVRLDIVGSIGARAVVTDAAGRFEATGLPAGTYHVVIASHEWRAEPLSVSLADGDARDVSIPLAVGPLSESIVVSAAQVETPLSQAPASVAVVDAEELRVKQSATIQEALRLVPGLTIARNGGRGALTSLFPRGGESDFTLVLVDGMRLNAFGGGSDLSQIALGNVERVEMVRGPQSAVFGSDAIGGVLQVVTTHDGPARGEVRAEGGSEATTNVSADTAGSAGVWSWGASLGRAASDGFTGTAPATGERVSNDDWWERQVAGSFGWQPGESSSIRAHVRRHESDRGFPGPYGSDPGGTFPGVDTISRGANDDRQAALAATHPWGRALAGRVRQRYAVTYGKLGSDYVSPFDSSTFETRRLNIRAQTDVLIGPSSSVTAGIEGQREQARSTYITGAQFEQIPVERWTVGYFGEWRQTLGAAASFTAGVRLDRIHRDALEGDPNPFSPRPAFAADDRTSVNPRVSFAWTPWESATGTPPARVHAAFATGIRPPDAYEIAFTDNPGLKPERSRSVEAGVDAQPAAVPVTLDATFFHNTFDDLIVSVGTFGDASRFRTDNISNARARGFELGGNWEPSAGITLRVAYTWLDTEILAVDRSGQAPPPFEVGDPLIRRPRHQASADLLVTRGRFAGFVDVGGRGRTLDIDPSLGTFGGLFPSAGFVVTNAGLTVRVHRVVDVFARVTNAFDRSYEEVLGFPALGRSGMAGVRLAVSR
jgi:outer membrane cobalamin receptor